jgi:hypothetical protein
LLSWLLVLLPSTFFLDVLFFFSPLCTVHYNVYLQCTVHYNVYLQCTVHYNVYLQCTVHYNVYLQCTVHYNVYLQCTVHYNVYLECTVHYSVYLQCTVHYNVYLQCTVHYNVYLQCTFFLSRTNGSKRFWRFSVSTGTKEDESSCGRLWAAEFHHITANSRLARVLKLMTRLFI